MRSEPPAVMAMTYDLSRWRDLATCEQLAVLVDLDGTLIDFAPTPDEAVLDDRAAAVLREVVAAGIQVVVVSGRPRHAIDAMRARVPGAWWVAEHGSWRWDGTDAVPPAISAPELASLERRLGSLLGVPGTLIERKTLSLCVHWRLVAAAERAGVVAALENACDEWLEEYPGYERMAGVELLEVRQRTVHKGTVVSWVRARMPGVRLLALGDDVTDEDMFAELGDEDASIGVGPRVMRVDARAADVRGAHAFLRWLVDARRGASREFPLVPLAPPAVRTGHRFLVMSNRTPAVTQGRTREVGGLVSALEPALRDADGVWLGWSGQVREHGSRVVVDDAVQPARARFDLPATVREQFYAGFCNSVLWPLFHGFPSRVRANAQDWEAYLTANERYAGHALELTRRDATLWVHDYHLLLAARSLRARGHQGRIGLFLHIPFPAYEVLSTIPWAGELVEGMLAHDLVGFQTASSAASFLAAARTVRGAVVDGWSVRHGGRTTQVGVYAATIDPAGFRTPAEDAPEVAGLRASLGSRRLILGVDRLDYSKGIPERLAAFERLLERSPDWHGRVVFLQVSVPSRAEIPDYAELREKVEALVGRINGRFGETDWVPVRYLYRSYEHRVLAQLYRLADVALVTPLRDGMNLVAKEFVVAQDPARPGVLVLSQFAGAAETLTDALVTNPFHPEGLAADLDQALRMPEGERVHRHRMLSAALEREGDARVWARRFLDDLVPRRLHAID
ncbi:MAG: trehalose-phosphatase [Myxococcales bacterium]|nr:trehalose-phosphatase [Myxococcales bacterium]